MTVEKLVAINATKSKLTAALYDGFVLVNGYIESGMGIVEEAGYSKDKPVADAYAAWVAFFNSTIKPLSGQARISREVVNDFHLRAKATIEAFQIQPLG